MENNQISQALNVIYSVILRKLPSTTSKNSNRICAGLDWLLDDVRQLPMWLTLKHRGYGPLLRDGGRKSKPVEALKRMVLTIFRSGVRIMHGSPPLVA